MLQNHPLLVWFIIFCILARHAQSEYRENKSKEHKEKVRKEIFEVLQELEKENTEEKGKAGKPCVLLSSLFYKANERFLPCIRSL